MNLSKTKQQAMDLLKSKWSHLYTFGYPTEPFPTSYKRDLDMVMLGICSEEIINNIVCAVLGISLGHIIDLRRDMKKKEQLLQLYKNILKQNNLPC